MTDRESLEGRVAIITGASRGIGRALALGLARKGCHVTIAAKTSDPDPRLPGTIHSVAAEVEAAGARALPFRLDVRDEREIEACIARTLETFGRIDILINNAGAIHLAPLADTSARRFDLLLGVNARAAFLLSRAVLPAMRARRWGHIVMMSPPQAPRLPGKTAYGLSKFGMTFIAQSLAEEVRADGVAVNALWPVTAIDTQATRHFWPGHEEAWRTPDIMMDATLALLTRPPATCTGHAYFDEDLLRETGLTDFSGYALVPGAEPPPFSRDLTGAGPTEKRN